MENKTSNFIIIVLVIIMCILTGVLGFVLGGIYYSSENSENDIVDKEEIEDNNDIVVDSNKLCNGTLNATYYGEYKDTFADGTISLHMKRRLYLNGDGTFNSVVENSEGAWGTYKIVDGVITFTQEPSYGIGDKIIYSNTISDDCTTIYVRNDYENYNLNKIS